MNQPSPNMPIEAQTETHRILDPQHQGMVVATFEHPRGWQAHSQVVWNFNDTSYPVAVYASTFNPNGTEALQFLPTESCFWVQGNVMYTPGQRYRGQTCLFPMSGLDALTRWAIPKYRGDRQNLRILYAQPVPNLAQMFRNDWLLSVPHEGVMARIGYEENGRSFEEEFYTCVMWHPPNGQQFNWGLINLCCFRAAQGELDAARQNLWRIVTSLRNNPEWGQVFATIIQQLHAQVRSFFGAVNAKLEAEKVQGQQLFEYRQWQANLNQQQFNARWESQERRAQQTGDVLAGRVSYEDPSNAYGNPHHDYGHHQYVWTNGRGEWIHSHEAGYNPNHDPNTLSRGPWSLARMAR